MEMKVVVDGVVRIINGVTEETTCKDIVFCLAQANKQFGRFILIEKWRNTEKLLSSHEHPMQVLNDLGQHAGDVQFIMKRCDSISNTSKRPTLSHHVDNDQNINMSFEHGEYTKTDDQHDIKPNVNLPSTSSASSVFKNTKNKIPKNNNKVSDIHMTPIQTTDYRNMNQHTEVTSQSLNDSSTVHKNSLNTLINCRPKRPPPYDEAIAKSSLINSSTSSLASQSVPSRRQLQVNQSYLDSKDENNMQFQNEYSSRMCQRTSLHESENVSHGDSSHILANVNKSRNEQINLSKESKLERDEQWHRDAIKLINMQKETLTSQRKELQELESQQNYWDIKLKIEETKNVDIDKDIRLLENIWIDQDSQLTNIDDQQLNEAIEDLKIKGGQLEANKTEISLKINETDSRIASCRIKIQCLLAEIQEFERRNDEKKDVICNQNELKERIFEKCKEEGDLLIEELNKFDKVTEDKLIKIDNLLDDIKNANMQGLTLLPKDDGQINSFLVMENNVPPATDRFCHRPGSTRRMTVSPRQLENAVATNKNPHGVWV